jgi:DNA adenine methylase
MHQHPPFSPSDSFLKWAGSKRRLLPQLLPLLPLRTRLVEPFLGAGSVFLAADFDCFLLGDANADLIAVWTALKQRPVEYIQAAQAFFTPENLGLEAYLRIREEFNDTDERFERAIRIPYLNKMAFNGLFRVNKAGAFNVPYAHPTKIPRFPLEEMEAAALKLRRCTLLNGGFAATLEQTGFGDAVYNDPPYLNPTAEKRSFTAYTPSGFGLAHHQELVECSRQAVSRGATVLISNHDTPETRLLYRGWEIHSLTVRRSMRATGEKSDMAQELVAILRPKPLGYTACYHGGHGVVIRR